MSTRHWSWRHLGVGLLMACGGTAAERPRPVLVATIDQSWGSAAWARPRPVYTESERAWIFWRFDPAMQIARDRAAGPIASSTAALAIATLRSPDGSHALGLVRFEQEGRQVLIYANLANLSPGARGFTIQEAGSCGEPASSEAGHFNPTHSRHGPIGSPVRHVGDLGNVMVEADGRAAFAAVTDSFRIIGDDSILGRTVVIHARRDDGKTQPTGNSGPAVACGIIQLGNSNRVASGD